MADTTSAKDLVGVIRKSPSLMITFGVVFVFILIYVYERSKNASAAATTGTQQPGQFAPALGTYTYVEDIHGTTGAAPVPIVGPVGPAGPIGPAGPAGPTRVPPIPKPPPNPTPVPSAWTALFSGKSPFPYKFGQNAYTTTIGGKQWTVGFGSGNRVWGVPGKVSIQKWQTTPIAIGQKQLLYQD